MAEAGWTSGGLATLPTGTVTFLFTDIEGSTSLLDRLGSAYTALLQRHHAILRRGIGEHAGFEVSVAGDGFFATFPRATDALNAAVAIQLELVRQEWPEGADVRVRMGLHTGEAEIVDGHYLGMAVHEASRIAGAGHGGQVLLSGATRALAQAAFRDGVTTTDLGAHRMKDIAEPVELFQLVHPELPRAFPPIRTGAATPAPLPDEPTPLLARDDLVADVLTRLGGGTRLVTLVGPGGIGKTRVSVAIARAFSLRGGEAWFAGLAPVDVGAVPVAVARAAGADLHGDVSVEESIIRSLTSRKGLLVLDNFEHVMKAAPLVPELLGALPDLSIVVTSREPLRLSAEVQVPVHPLSVPPEIPDVEAAPESFDAVQLFLARAAAVAPNFQPTPSNLEAVANICRRLDGIPLAIELAAGRLRTASAQELRGELDLLDLEGAHDAPDRHQTLRKTVQWSYELLEAPEAQLLRRLAIFVGGWSASAAAHVCRAEDDAVETSRLLGELVDQSLLRRQDTEEGATRFDMLETVRAFALEELVKADEREAISRAHARHFVELAEQAAPRLATGEAPAWLAHLHRDRANLRAAFEYLCAIGDRATALRLVRASIPRWRVQGELAVGAIWIDEVLTVGTPLRSPDEAVVLACRSEAARRRRDDRTAERCATEALSIARDTDDQPALLAALITQASVRSRDYKGRSEVDGLVEEAGTLAREIGDPTGIIDVLIAKSHLASLVGNPTGRRAALQEAEELAREIEDRWRLAKVAAGTAAIGLFGDPAAQVRAAQLFAELGDLESELEALARLLANARTSLPILRKYAARQTELAARAGDTEALVGAQIRLAKLELTEARPEGYHRAIQAAVSAAMSDPNFCDDRGAKSPPDSLAIAVSEANVRAGHLRRTRARGRPARKGPETLGAAEGGAALARVAAATDLGLPRIAVGAAFGFGFVATANAIRGEPVAWGLGAVAAAFAIVVISFRRSDSSSLFGHVLVTLPVIFGSLDWGAVLIVHSGLIALFRTLLPRARPGARLGALAVAAASIAALATGQARPGPVPLAVLLSLQVVRSLDRTPAAFLLRTGTYAATFVLGLFASVLFDTSLTAAASDMWLVALTFTGALTWAAGISICGGPFRPLGWATGLMAVAGVAAWQEPQWAPVWGGAALALTWALLLAAAFVKTWPPLELPVLGAKAART